MPLGLRRTPSPEGQSLPPAMQEYLKKFYDFRPWEAGKASSVEGGFEHQLELLTIAIRAWWEDLKQEPRL